MKITTAVVLVGGKGTRLRDVVSDRPKPLAEVNGRPFLAYLLDRIVALGMARTVLCTGFMAAAVREAMGAEFGGMPLVYSEEDAPLGTGGAVRKSIDAQDPGDGILMFNGDSYCDADLEGFLENHSRTGAEVSMVLTKVDDAGAFGAVSVDADGRVLAFREKAADAGPGWINAGIYAISRSRLEEIPPGRKVSIEREMFPRWVPSGINGFRSEGAFIDIGTPESYARAQAFFADRDSS